MSSLQDSKSQASSVVCDAMQFVVVNAILNINDKR